MTRKQEVDRKDSRDLNFLFVDRPLTIGVGNHASGPSWQAAEKGHWGDRKRTY